MRYYIHPKILFKKCVRFSDKNRHQVFIEPEGEYTNEMYISGASSSMPEDVQYAFYSGLNQISEKTFEYIISNLK